MIQYFLVPHSHTSRGRWVRSLSHTLVRRWSRGNQMPGGTSRPLVSLVAEVDEGYVKVFVIFSALLQQLPQDKSHVCRGSGFPEATLRFQKHSLRDVLNQSAEHDLGTHPYLSRTRPRRSSWVYWQVSLMSGPTSTPAWAFLQALLWLSLFPLWTANRISQQWTVIAIHWNSQCLYIGAFCIDNN